MTADLQDAQRSRGGETRASNQSETDRKFLATLAASRRPLKNDVKLSDDELIRVFREMSEAGPGVDRKWIIFLIVGRDGRTIRSSLPDKTIRERLKIIGGAIGFMGVTIFGTPQKDSRAPSIQVYYKPLKRGTAVIDALDKASRDLVTAIIPRMKLSEKDASEVVG